MKLWKLISLIQQISFESVPEAGKDSFFGSQTDNFLHLLSGSLRAFQMPPPDGSENIGGDNP